MKKIISLLSILIFTISSCEDVIEVDLNSAQQRLVIDASINWVKGTSGNSQEIKLTLTADFYDNGVPVATGANVTVTQISNGTVYNFIEDSTTGIYRTNSFNPILNEEYELNIIYNGETYTARETLLPVVPIDFIEQINDGGFGGDEIEIKAFYTDPANIENYYFFEFDSGVAVIPSLDVYDDEFTDGNQIFGFYSEEDLAAGDIVNIKNHGVSERFYEFMFLLLQQGSEETDGPFQTQPASVRGNCINVSNSDNFPFGYFRLSEVDEVNYTVQ